MLLLSWQLYEPPIVRFQCPWLMGIYVQLLFHVVFPLISISTHCRFLLQIQVQALLRLSGAFAFEVLGLIYSWVQLNHTELVAALLESHWQRSLVKCGSTATATTTTRMNTFIRKCFVPLFNRYGILHKPMLEEFVRNHYSPQ